MWQGCCCERWTPVHSEPHPAPPSLLHPVRICASFHHEHHYSGCSSQSRLQRRAAALRPGRLGLKLEAENYGVNLTREPHSMWKHSGSMEGHVCVSWCMRLPPTTQGNLTSGRCTCWLLFCRGISREIYLSASMQAAGCMNICWMRTEADVVTYERRSDLLTACSRPMTWRSMLTTARWHARDSSRDACTSA